MNWCIVILAELAVLDEMTVVGPFVSKADAKQWAERQPWPPVTGSNPPWYRIEPMQPKQAVLELT